MDSSPNLVSVHSSGCAPRNSNGTFEESRTTRADSKRARTGNSSGNGEVSARSVLLRVIFALSFYAARLRIVCVMPISPALTQRLYRKFEGESIQVHGAILRGALIPGDI